MSAPALAQQQPTLPGQSVPAVTCGPSNNSPACQDLRQALPGGRLPGIVAPRTPEPPLIAGPVLPRHDMDDVRGQRFIPPGIMAFLHDNRIDPLIRAYLIGMAGKRQAEWTLQDLQFLTNLMPTLTEMHIATATLSEFYEFMGLDPASLFEPQLGTSWQVSASELDPRSRGKRGPCLDLARIARSDPASVQVQDMLTCADAP